MIYLLFATIFFVANWIFLRKKVMEYSIVATFIYLVAFVFIQSFDILYVEYVFFFILPHIKDFRKISVLHFAFLAYILFECVIGIIYEPINSVFATFLTRFFPLLFISLINTEKPVLSFPKKDYEQKLIRLIVLLECFLSVLLFVKGTPGDVFVVSHQPVGGNLSIIGIFLILNSALQSQKELKNHRVENIFYIFLLTIITLISGIRGYIIIVLPCAFYAVIAYLFDKPKKRKLGLALSIFLSLGILVFSFLIDGRMITFLSGIDTSVGYREIEAAFFFHSLKSMDPIRWFLGFGIGTKGARIGSWTLIYALSRGSLFYVNHLSNGAVLLNFWLTLLKDMGLIGFAIYLYLYVHMIPKRSSRPTPQRSGWILYAVLYAFMLLYRTSCTNSLIELYLFVMVMCNPLFQSKDRPISITS